MIILLVAAVQLMIIYFGGALFRCDPLSPRELGAAAMMAFTVIPMGILMRAVTDRRKK